MLEHHQWHGRNSRLEMPQHLRYCRIPHQTQFPHCYGSSYLHQHPRHHSDQSAYPHLLLSQHRQRGLRFSLRARDLVPSAFLLLPGSFRHCFPDYLWLGHTHRGPYALLGHRDPLLPFLRLPSSEPFLQQRVARCLPVQLFRYRLRLHH